MIQDLKLLIQLQEIDLRIKEQESAKEQYPVSVRELEAQIAEAVEAKEIAAAKLATLTNNANEMSKQAERLRESLAKSEEKTSAVQTNREYDAIHAEIEGQKSMLAAAVSKKSHLDVNIEKCKTILEAAEAEVARVKAEMTPQIDELNAKIAAIDSTIADITKERDALLPSISEYIRKTYLGIHSKRKNGRAVSVVADAKACAVCFMVLRPQLYSEIRRGNDFTLCENCGSMLVWGGE